MSTNDNISHKFVNIIKHSEKLSSNLQYRVTEIRSKATSLEIHEVIISLRSSSPNIKSVLEEFPNIKIILTEFADIDFKV
jgi:hypothetical protein